jgi:NAD(P)-dependent dehydrogenase (short-subunit alcohol dehydrogenase family)
MRSISELASLQDRVALIIGGAGHIGSTMCDALDEMGAIVIVADLPQVVAKTPADRGRTIIPVDLRDETATRDMVTRATRVHGRLDIVVHAAAYVGTTNVAGWNAPFDEQRVDAWDDAIRVNLTSAFVVAQAGRAALAARGSGSLIFVSSIYGVVAPDFRLYEGTAMHNPAGYGASKAGLRQLARYLSTLFAPQVRVNVITPGGVHRGQPAPFVDRYVDRTPLGRMAQEEDFKGAVAFLASDLSSYVTGQEVIVDGGWTTW